MSCASPDCLSASAMAIAPSPTPRRTLLTLGSSPARLTTLKNSQGSIHFPPTPLVANDPFVDETLSDSDFVMLDPVLDAENLKVLGLPDDEQAVRGTTYRFEALVMQVIVASASKVVSAIVSDGTSLLRIVTFNEPAFFAMKDLKETVTYCFELRLTRCGAPQALKYTYSLCRRELVVDRVVHISQTGKVDVPTFDFMAVCQTQGPAYQDLPCKVYFTVWIYGTREVSGHLTVYLAGESGLSSCDYPVVASDVALLKSQTKLGRLEKSRWRILARPFLANKEDFNVKSVFLRETHVSEWKFLGFANQNEKRSREEE